LVIDAEGLKWYEENGIAITYALPNIVRPGEVSFSIKINADVPA
jgi:hypothetical protein